MVYKVKRPSETRRRGTSVTRRPTSPVPARLRPNRTPSPAMAAMFGRGPAKTAKTATDATDAKTAKPSTAKPPAKSGTDKK